MATLAAALFFGSASLVSAPAAAQAVRNFPPQALRGELVVSAPPEAVLNGQPARLAPGARLRGENNLMQVSASLAGGRWLVHYTLDSSGAIAELWVLTAAEAAIKPWPSTATEAATWVYDPLAQRWNKP